MLLARRSFVTGFVLLGLAGALNHTIAERLFGRRFDLVLPQLKYGFVMFNKNPHQVSVYSYAGADGVRHDLADLVRTPAPFYKRARLAMNLMLERDYLAEVCYRARRAEKLTVLVDQWDLDVDLHRPQRTDTFPCEAHDLLRR